MTPAIIIFSDLDGTLLDHTSYSFEAALPALQLIHQRKIPLILVSSKTREEMHNYQRRLDLEAAPFVVENGSAIIGPRDFFSGVRQKKVIEHMDCLILGKTYSEIKSNLQEISLKHRYTIRGFHNATLEEIQEKTRLSNKDAKMAMKREFSVPLFFDDQAEKILRQEKDKYQLQILLGGRFMHLLGMTDKGKAVRLILNQYREKNPGLVIKSIVLGDSLNDEAMLQAADYPVLVKKKDGFHEKRIKIEGLIHSPGIGPHGWNQSLMNLLNEGV